MPRPVAASVHAGHMRLVLLVALLGVVACGPTDAGPGGARAVSQPTPARTAAAAATEQPSTQKGMRHILYSHCGVLSTTVEGVLWLAEPRLADDSGNPPPGWDENETPGLFRQTDSEHAVFVADSGVQARFTRAKPGESDPGAGCE